jgi:tripartite-type tricarboxylate transporter receptor subunit TctC
MTARRIFLSAAMAAGLCLIAAAPGATQPYPNRPIKIIVPFAPGGADVIARLVADRLSSALGQPVIIENRPGGAGGTVGTKAVTLADPDGYTLTLASPGPITVAPAVYKNLDYDPIRQLVPIAMIATSPFVLVVNPEVPAKSVSEFVAYSKANPGKVNYVSPGFGTSSHLFGELLKLRTGAEILHVPYRGATPAIADLVAGQVQMFFDNIRNLQSFIQSGKLRALAVTSEKRHPEMPELPTMIEAGIDGFVGFYWNGLLAPAGTPPAIINRINTIINDGLKSDMRATVIKLGMEPKSGSPQDFAAFIADEVQRWNVVVRDAKL